MRYRRSTLHALVDDRPSKQTFRAPRRPAVPLDMAASSPPETPAARPGAGVSDAVSGTGTFNAVPDTGVLDLGPSTGALDVVSGISALDAVPGTGAFDLVSDAGGFTSLVDGPRPDPDQLTGFVDVVGITEATHDVKTFELHAPWMESVDFAPGQYVTMRIPELGLERCYSISSAPFGTNIFTITVKRVLGGAVSTHLHDRVRAGDRLHVDGPYGLFSTSFHPAGRHLFLSAGSGITPIMSMIRSLLARPSGIGTDIAVVHSAATPADIIFRSELEQLAEVAGVSITMLCSRDSDAEAWTGRRGRIDADTLAEVVPDAVDRETFVCGPAPYLDTVRSLLAEVGVAEDRLHEESFVVATTTKNRLAQRGARITGAGTTRSGAVASVSGTGSPSAGICHAIDFTLSGVRVDCDPATTVLDAAAEAGLTVPSSCAEGKCGTCKSVLVSGEVEMDHRGGIRPKEIAAGKFLPCCSTPRSDLVVDR